jgi:hypothetical protein
LSIDYGTILLNLDEIHIKKDKNGTFDNVVQQGNALVRKNISIKSVAGDDRS